MAGSLDIVTRNVLKISSTPICNPVFPPKHKYVNMFLKSYDNLYFLNIQVQVHLVGNHWAGTRIMVMAMLMVMRLKQLLVSPL